MEIFDALEKEDGGTADDEAMGVENADAGAGKAVAGLAMIVLEPEVVVMKITPLTSPFVLMTSSSINFLPFRKKTCWSASRLGWWCSTWGGFELGWGGAW